jgi:hypothetical protein
MSTSTESKSTENPIGEDEQGVGNGSSELLGLLAMTAEKPHAQTWDGEDLSWFFPATEEEPEEGGDCDEDLLLSADVWAGISAEMQRRNTWAPSAIRTGIQKTRARMGLAATALAVLAMGTMSWADWRGSSDNGTHDAIVAGSLTRTAAKPATEARVVRSVASETAASIAQPEAALVLPPAGIENAAAPENAGSLSRAHRSRHGFESADPSIATTAALAIDGNPYGDSKGAGSRSADARESAASAPAGAVAAGTGSSFEERVESLIASALDRPAKVESARVEPAIQTPEKDVYQVPDLPSRRDVERAVSALTEEVRSKCKGEAYERIVVQLTVSGSTGRVTSARTVDADHSGTSVGRCAARVAGLAKLPRFAKNEIVVRYPFEL